MSVADCSRIKGIEVAFPPFLMMIAKCAAFRFIEADLLSAQGCAWSVDPRKLGIETMESQWSALDLPFMKSWLGTA